jgi:prophage maintenance system killer protein
VRAFKLTANYVEMVHDELVSRYWLGAEPVSRDEYRSRAAIESAVNRPFQTFGGIEFYLTIHENPLFHSLVCNHCFFNGNKRTAVIVLDSFLLVNGFVLALDNTQMYWLAKETASHNEQGLSSSLILEDILKTIRMYTVPLHKLKSDYLDSFKLFQTGRLIIRRHPLNQPGNV